ncbi:4Fe-4S binding protein [Trichormus azollae]|uniref:4Fe-4S binding protein n=1 Tax=Trichormus azollae TaxID=1164 RepID=UPI003D32DE0A
MIELVSESWCIECNICIQVCPINVFDKVPDLPPIIARQSGNDYRQKVLYGYCKICLLYPTFLEIIPE